MSADVESFCAKFAMHPWAAIRLGVATGMDLAHRFHNRRFFLLTLCFALLEAVEVAAAHLENPAASANRMLALAAHFRDDARFDFSHSAKSAVAFFNISFSSSS